MTDELALMFFNSGRDQQLEEYDQAYKRLRRQALHSDVPALIAIVDTPNLAALLRVFKVRNGWRRQHLRTDTPVLAYGIPPRWTLGRTVRACAGLAHLTPPRSIRETVVRLPSGHELAFLVTQFPVGVRNRNRNAAQARHLPELEQRYALVDHALEEAKARHLLAGRSVATAVDRNDPSWSPLRVRERVVVHAGLDYITVIPAHGRRLASVDRMTFPMPIEAFHRGLWARIVLEEVDTSA